jgi:hypothetical protein
VTRKLVARRNDAARFAREVVAPAKPESESMVLLHFGDVASRNQVGAAGTDFNQENYQ